MNRSYTIAIVGATGLVGNALLSILEQRNFPVGGLFLLAGDRSSGQFLLFRGRQYTVTPLVDFNWRANKIDIAFFSAGNEISLKYAPTARDSGCIVIDNSSAFRYDDIIPLILSEVNGDKLRRELALHVDNKTGMIIANPNCSTMQMLLVLAPIHRAVGIKRVIVATYQAVSGAGRDLMDDLERGESSVSSIHANLIPQIDTMHDNDYSREEMKMLWESRKILDAPELLLSATAVRVPVMNGHSEAVVIETQKPINVAQAHAYLKNQPGLIVLQNCWVTPKEVSGKDEVFVSRLRQDLAFGNRGLACWIVGDNLRKGAALNAVQIAEIGINSI